ncbi:NADPH:quinone reductase [Streptomyces sp. BpilaLS-43]|nr:NADP-dependent oxidoreductase [Streptomyces sp. BpilaLS-43]SCD80623.1 NADPH:quinone reductase [Streptomyces sp. BpilaLS-43]
MKAVGAKQFGGPRVLEVLELPVPEAGPGQVRIRVRAAAVNPTDTMLRNGAVISAWRQKEPPYVPGMEAAGTVEQIGMGTRTDLRVGDRVMAVIVPVGSHGAYAEQIVVPADSLARSPANASDVEAATLPMNGLTARLALDDLRLRPGDTVAVTGAAGAVGGYVIELAKADGLRVFADAAPKDEALVRGLGADVVLPRGDDFPLRVRAEVPGGVDGAVDTALLERRLLPAVRDGGRIATLRRFEEEGERDVTFHPVVVSEHAREADKLERLRRQAEVGLLTLRVAEVLPAREAAEAHRRLEEGGVRGRLVLTF